MKVIKRIFSFLLAVLLLFATYAPSVYATQLITEEKKKIYAQNGIVFPTDECDPNAANQGGMSTCTPITGSDITWIGDSYSVEAEKEVGNHLISNKFPGVDFGGEENINTASGYIQYSKHFSSSVAGNPSGLDILKKIKTAGKLRKYLVFALGTNDEDWGTAAFRSTAQS
ncbi:MAG: hypothetical protein Q4C03_04630, partial [bacterium]|nr:hypothetical protein [bacterium]